MFYHKKYFLTHSLILAFWEFEILIVAGVVTRLNEIIKCFTDEYQNKIMKKARSRTQDDLGLTQGDLELTLR